MGEDPHDPAREHPSAPVSHHLAIHGAAEIGVRSDDEYAKVQRAAAYIESELRSLGYAVVSQEFSAAGRTYRNLEATLADTTLRHEGVVIGAHYDTADEAPGADDNASGVAAVLELARVLAGTPQARTVGGAHSSRSSGRQHHTCQGHGPNDRR